MSRASWAASASPVAGLVAWFLMPLPPYASAPFCVAALVLGTLGRSSRSRGLRALAVVGLALGVTASIAVGLYLLFLLLAALDVAE